MSTSRSSARPPGSKRSPALGPLGAVLVTVLWISSACSRAEGGNRWVHLARGHRPASPEEVARAWNALEPRAAPVAVDEDPETGRTWLSTPLGPEAWKRDEETGVWRTAVPFPAWGTDARLLGPEGELKRTADARALEHRSADETPVTSLWSLNGRRIFLALESSPESPPGLLRFQTVLSRGAAATDGLWRAAVGDYAGEGIALVPGIPERVSADVPPGSVLRFFTTAFAEDGGGQARLTLEIDGEEVFWTRQAVDRSTRGEWHEVPLGKRSGRAVFAFTLEGAATEGAFLAPVIGPARIGGPAERPWGRARPSFLVFLADTFRADNLSAYGGEHGAAPYLDRLVAESRTFLRTWSTASWTLPAQASLLSGVYPPQHGAVKNRLPMDEGLVTLTERLAHHGYRTGAITDSGFVAAGFGFDQGFEWFEENRGRSLAQTLDSARAFLAADDGRPTFLYVQTYRTHHPYRDGLDEDGSRWSAFVAEVEAELEGPRTDSAMNRLLVRRSEELYDLYLGSVRGLDAAFGPWHAELRDAGWFENGYLVFTSDHGEAFGEHEEVKHGGLLWDEKLRVPLFLHGAGMEPGVEDRAASLVDLPRTLAHLAGIEPRPEWRGTALTELSVERPLFAFGAELRRYPPHLALLEGDRKVLGIHRLEGLEEGELERAFDLAADPGETRDVGSTEAWAAELCRRLAPLVGEVSRPLVAPEAVTLDKDRMQDLQDLGYAEH